ncbi:hypothetical protein ABPG74_009865 [Tetrahymena malaccensis]
MKTQVFQEQNQQSANILDNSNQIQYVYQNIFNNFNSENQIEDVGAANLLNNLSGCVNLAQLQVQLEENIIKNLDVSSIFKILSNLIHFQQLNLNISYNKITDKSILNFQQSLIECKNLIYFKFSFIANNFSLNGTSKLIDQILKCKTIEKLRLNPFIHQSILDCSTALNDCQNLKNLTLKFQKFKNEELKNLGICLANCKNIKNLTVNISQDSNFNDEQEVIDFLQDISFNHQIFTLNLFLPQDNQIFHNQYLYFNKRFSWNEQFQLNRQKIAHFIKELQEVSIFLDRLY